MSRYAVIVPWCDRPEIELTLRHNARWFAAHDVEVVVVNAGGNVCTLHSCLARAGLSRVRLIDLPGATFNRALCLNVGTAASDGECLFFLDADILLHEDVFADAEPHLRRGGRYVAIDRIAESDREKRSDSGLDLRFLADLMETTMLTTIDGRSARFVRRRSPAFGERGGDGLILLATADLLRVDGLNAELRGWGFEDTDLQMRLQFALDLERITVGTVTHLTHDGATRDEQAYLRNMAHCTQRYSRGQYLGTLSADFESWRSRLVESSPLAQPQAEI